MKLYKYTTIDTNRYGTDKRVVFGHIVLRKMDKYNDKIFVFKEIGWLSAISTFAGISLSSIGLDDVVILEESERKIKHISEVQNKHGGLEEISTKEKKCIINTLNKNIRLDKESISDYRSLLEDIE